MSFFADGREENRSTGKLSREDIESLVVVHAAESGCSVRALAERLGLSAALEATLLEGLAPIAARGWISIDGGIVVSTAEGRSRLERSL